MIHSKLFRSGALFILCLIGVPFLFGAGNGPDAALVRDIENHLMAPCCWQPLYGHESAVADEMRGEIRTMAAAGMGREAILDRFVAQYGERVLAKPRPEGFNRLLDILPWAVLALGAWMLIVLLKKLRSPAAVTPPLESPPDSRYARVIEKELKDLDEE